MMHTASNNPGSGPLVRFYLGTEPDSSGRLISDIRKWNHERLERMHITGNRTAGFWRSAAGIKPREHELKHHLILGTVHDARLRTDWLLTTAEDRRAKDSARTAAHNALVDAANILSRAMVKAGKDATWCRDLGDNRKEIGDWARHIHARLGIAERHQVANHALDRNVEVDYQTARSYSIPKLSHLGSPCPAIHPYCPRLGIVAIAG